MLREAVTNAQNGLATIFGYYVNDPERFGIVEFDKSGRVLIRGGKACASQEQLLHHRPVFL